MLIWHNNPVLKKNPTQNKTIKVVFPKSSAATTNCHSYVTESALLHSLKEIFYLTLEKYRTFSIFSFYLFECYYPQQLRSLIVYCSLYRRNRESIYIYFFFEYSVIVQRVLKPRWCLSQVSDLQPGVNSTGWNLIFVSFQTSLTSSEASGLAGSNNESLDWDFKKWSWHLRQR